MILVIERTTVDCTTEMVQNKFDNLFQNQVTMVVEETMADQNGPFKRFSITLEWTRGGFNSLFIDEIKEHGDATIYDDDIMWIVTI